MRARGRACVCVFVRTCAYACGVRACAYACGCAFVRALDTPSPTMMLARAGSVRARESSSARSSVRTGSEAVPLACDAARHAAAQRTAMHNGLERITACCKASLHVATHPCMLPRITTRCSASIRVAAHHYTLQRITRRCNTSLHVAIHHYTLQRQRAQRHRCNTAPPACADDAAQTPGRGVGADGREGRTESEPPTST